MILELDVTRDLDRQASGVDADGGRCTIYEATLRHTATATATATEVGFPPLLYLALNRFLRFPSDYPNLDMVSFPVLLYLLKFVSVVGISKWFTSVLAMSRESLFWSMLFQFLVQFFTLCHAPNPGPIRLADPNRFPGRETIYWDSLPDFFLKPNWYLWVWPTSYNRIKISYTFTESHLQLQN